MSICSICPCFLFHCAPFYFLFHSLCVLLSISLSLSFSLISSLPLLSLNPSISLSTSTRSGKVGNVGRIYRGFHGSAVKLHSGTSFSRARVTRDIASRFVLPYCRELSRRWVLTIAARPIHQRFRFPRVSGNSVCSTLPPSSFLSRSSLHSLAHLSRKFGSGSRCGKAVREFNSALNFLHLGDTLPM